jgi:hypothetical protein
MPSTRSRRRRDIDLALIDCRGPSPARFDRKWLYQVALPDENWHLYCLADEASAQAFLDHFPGVMFDPKARRENGKARGVWRRPGEYKRTLDLGPLSVPDILRN